MHARTLSKVLSANDVGETGSHQAGIVVPRVREALAFFPRLDNSEVNPRCSVHVRDHTSGNVHELNYIYYNGRLHGTSTRNEYRLTGMTSFLRDYGAVAGDRVDFVWAEESGYSIEFVPGGGSGSSDGDVIVLSGTWFSSRRNAAG